MTGVSSSFSDGAMNGAIVSAMRLLSPFCRDLCKRDGDTRCHEASLSLFAVPEVDDESVGFIFLRAATLVSAGTEAGTSKKGRLKRFMPCLLNAAFARTYFAVCVCVLSVTLCFFSH